MVLVTCRRPLRPGLVSRMLCRSANSIGETSALAGDAGDAVEILAVFLPAPAMQAAVFIWLAATRPRRHLAGARLAAGVGEPGALRRRVHLGAHPDVRLAGVGVELFHQLARLAGQCRAGVFLDGHEISSCRSDRGVAPPSWRFAYQRGISPWSLFATAGGQCRPAIEPHAALMKFADRLGELLRLLQVGKVTGPFEFDHSRSWHGLLDRLDARRPSRPWCRRSAAWDWRCPAAPAAGRSPTAPPRNRQSLGAALPRSCRAPYPAPATW